MFASAVGDADSEWPIVIVGMQEKPHASKSDVMFRGFWSLTHRTSPSVKGIFCQVFRFRVWKQPRATTYIHPWGNSWNRTAKDNICVYLSSNAGETPLLCYAILARLPIIIRSSPFPSTSGFPGCIIRIRWKIERSSVSDSLFTLDSHKAIMLSLLPPNVNHRP